MGERFAGYGENTTVAEGGVQDTTIILEGVAVTRGKIYEILIACETAIDAMMRHTVRRFDTAEGSGTGFTPIKLDPDGPAAQMTCIADLTVEPTYIADAFLIRVPVNARATFRWVAAPGGELLVPAAINEGIGVYSQDIAAATPDVATTIHWEE